MGFNEGGIQPWVVMTPPGRSAPCSNSKYGFWKSVSAGPSGSLESVMITSNSSFLSARNLNPSPMWVFTAGCWKPTDMPGRYFFDRRMTACVNLNL